MNLTEIGNRIKLCRKKQKITQEMLAEKLNVSPHYIYEIERGSKTMSLQMLVKISVTLNISTDYILFGKTFSESPVISDELTQIIDALPVKNRTSIAHILSVIIPYLR